MTDTFLLLHIACALATCVGLAAAGVTLLFRISYAYTPALFFLLLSAASAALFGVVLSLSQPGAGVLAACKGVGIYAVITAVPLMMLIGRIRRGVKEEEVWRTVRIDNT